ncbi:MAG: hypothetical protein A2252_06695 [Elusimicrobia bacterium RIFOXYA2_FULL_39_19]|nr:MAG: hypothetical protein A2252_06695 [Elusimicrobia bacterium RIFOXYA2_FULL_39_19]
MSKKNIIFTALLIIGLAVNSFCGVSDPIIATDVSPDNTTLEKIVANVINSGMTDEQKVMALWKWNMLHVSHNAGMTEPFMGTTNSTVRDTIKFLHCYGFAVCGDNATLSSGLYDAAGFPTRIRHLGSHTVPEVYYDGAWHYYDANQAGYAINNEGKVASSNDLAIAQYGNGVNGDPTLLGPQASPNPPDPHFPGNSWSIVPGYPAFVYNCYNGWYPNNPYDIGPQWYEIHVDAHRMNFTLKENETFTRYFHPQGFGASKNVWWGTASEPYRSGTTFALNFVLQDPGNEFSVSSGKRYHGNGQLVWNPDFTSGDFWNGVESYSNVGTQGSSPKLYATSGTGEIIFLVETPYPIGASPATTSVFDPGATNGAIISGDAVGTAALDVSINHGATWTSYGSVSGSFSEDITDQVKGHYLYWARFRFSAGSNGLDNLQFDTRTMMSNTMLPWLNEGTNNIEYNSSGLSCKTFIPDIWTSQAVYEAKRLSDSNVYWYNNSLKHLCITDKNQKGYVIYQMDAPNTIEKITASFAYAQGIPTVTNQAYRIYVSVDNGSTWTQAGEFYPPNKEYSAWGFMDGELDISAAGVNSCQVKFEMDPQGNSSAGISAMQIYALYQDPSTSDLKITYAWNETKTLHTDERTVPGSGTSNYSIFCGASTTPVYVRMEVISANGKTTITGSVKDSGGSGISGVDLALSGSSTGSYTTGGSGFYTFSVSTGGTYTVTPTKTDWSFSPVNLSFANITSAQSNQNFTGTYSGSGYSIGGTVTSSTGSALGGVPITLSGSASGSTTTNGSGAYQFSSVAPGNYVVTPSLSNWAFSPINRTYTGLGDNQSNQNFTGTFIIPAGYSEFVCSIKATGGDYTSLSAWETAIQSDLTSSAVKVFNGIKTGTINDAATVSGATSGATGTVYHCTQTQIYLNVTGGTFQAGEQIRVNASNYFTANNSGDKVIAVAECYSMTDTTPLTIAGWTTSTTNYIEIRTPASYKHSGQWDTDAYIMNTGAAASDSIYINEANVRINGLQINVTKDDTATSNGIQIYGDATSPEDIRINNCIIKGAGNFTTNSKRGIFTAASAVAGSKVRIYNNIFYDFKGTGSSYIGAYIKDASRTCYLYNNTAVNCEYGYYRDLATVIVKNNIAQDCTDGFGGGGWDAASDYNLSDIASDAPGTNSKNATTVTFESKTNKNFHIAEADASAKDFGMYLSTDTYLSFSTDIDGDSRSGSWDIGADEYSGGAGSDITPPEPPTNLAVLDQTETSLTISWTASVQASDGDYAEYYKIYRDAVLAGTTTGLNFTDTGLSAGTTYNYKVYSVDDIGNQCSECVTADFNTSGSGADTTPPNPPTSLDSSVQTETSITLTWTASAQASDNDYASYYKVYRNAVLAGSPGDTTFTDTGLTKNTTYSYTVYAVDDAGNQSTSAASKSFSTSGADTTAPTIVSVIVTNATTVTVVFSEPVDQTTAETKANYSINNSINIAGAVLDSDEKTVTLTTSQHSIGTTYTITISSIKDQAGTPNTIAANSTMNYMYGDTVAPGNVTSLSVMDNPTDRGGKAIVSWTKVSDNDIAGYKVYYSPVPFSSITGATYFSGSPVSNLNASSCVVTGLIVNSQDYYFGVLAVDLSGNVSTVIANVGPVRAINNRLGETINGQKVYEITMNCYNLKAKVIATPGLNDGVYVNIKKPETKALKISQANTAAQNDTKIMSTTINDLSDTSTEFNALLSLVDRVTIVLSYPSTITGETENGLRIYCLNETTEEWELVPGAQELSPLANTVAVEVGHFSVYRIMGAVLSKDNLKEVRVYPNPFKPNDTKSETGTWDRGIAFENLTNNSTIKIYTLTGEPVITLEETDNDGKYTWDVKNKEKEKLSSGTYIYKITNTTGEKITGKIGIVR